ncbi:threonine-phosphate decarboxylase [Oceanospirillum sanctuarii]|uniref:threonine-phosphate decarboxylase n=1 Tax=Oceanospirillum sanctuarii TaxID=1434821 RepID=UPI000A3D5CB8|nr:threonine-phosphate decarboxylase [Oceanospirillum sanctuarii]
MRSEERTGTRSILSDKLPLLTTPVHGGDLQRAKAAYPHVEDWLDLSAGLNPDPWPIPEIPQSCFSQLPDGYESLLDAASDYYGHSHLWPVNGSQQGIELLPQLISRRFEATGQGFEPSRKKVAVPEEGYQEHAWCWQKAGFDVYRYRAEAPAELISCAEACDVLVVINPNNPTGQIFSREELLACHQVLAEKAGCLILDEAFMDAYELDSQSLADSASDSLIVLRSIGKFFGLAGIRSGFVLAGESTIVQLKIMTGPWPVSGVTAWLTEQMLQDKEWQLLAREKLARQSTALRSLLEDVFFGAANAGTSTRLRLCYTPLFASLVLAGGEDAARKLQQRLAAQGVWIRVFSNTGRIRLGLPKDEWEIERLEAAFAASTMM